MLRKIKSNVATKIHLLLSKHGYAIGLLVLICAGLTGFVHDHRPFAPDDILALSFGTIRSPLSFMTGNFVNFLPAYRPVSMISIWIQYQLAGIEPVSYYLFNIVIWLGCVVLFYRLMFHFTGSREASFGAALFLLADFRTATLYFWFIERQNPMAIIFGLSAVILFIKFDKNERWNRFTNVWVIALLLLSALSKEYGLVFIGVLVLYALLFDFPNLKKAFVIAVIVSVIYLGMRFSYAGGSNLGFCAEIGYLDQASQICYQDIAFPQRVKFYIWNVAATFMGTFFPGLFSSVGQWLNFEILQPLDYEAIFSLSYVELGFSTFLVCMVILSFYQRPKIALLFLSIILFNSVLNFPLYRSRNQLVSLIGLYGFFGLGISYLWGKIQVQHIKLISGVFVLVLIIVSGLKIGYLSHYLELISYSYNISDPCDTLTQHHHPENIDREIVKQLKIKYGLSNPECLP
jgi:hypothetical protein